MQPARGIGLPQGKQIGSKSSNISGLRPMWPPSGRIDDRAPRRAVFVPLRVRLRVPSAHRPNSASAIAARRRDSPASPRQFPLQKKLSAAESLHETAIEGRSARRESQVIATERRACAAPRPRVPRPEFGLGGPPGLKNHRQGRGHWRVPPPYRQRADGGASQNPRAPAPMLPIPAQARTASGHAR